MIRSVDLIHFKGFKRFTVNFAGSVYVVGPNNAGKTTLVQSLRACAHMLRYASTRSPEGYRRVDGRQMLAYDLGDPQLPLVVENIRHEFIPDECRIRMSPGRRGRLGGNGERRGSGSGFEVLVLTAETTEGRGQSLS